VIDEACFIQVCIKLFGVNKAKLFKIQILLNLIKRISCLVILKP